MGIRNTIYRPASESPPRKGHRDRHQTKPPVEREDRIPPPAPNFSPTGWQRERIQRLARICRCLERGQASGKRLRRMVRFHAWRWRDRHYECDPARAIRFKASTILRIYRLWRKGGGTPAALALHYWRRNRKAYLSQVIELSKLCLAPETNSFSAAYRKLPNPGATHWAFRVAIPARLRVALAALLAHRRHEQVLERAARQILEGVAK